MQRAVWLVLAAPALLGCQSNTNVSAPDVDQTFGASFVTVQNETRMVRALNPQNNQPRLVLVYNDDTRAWDPNDPDRFLAGRSLKGWATSVNQGETWTRHDQLTAPQQALPVPGGAPVTLDVMRGDPWIAARKSLVLYTNIGQQGLTELLGMGARAQWVVLSRSRDGGASFEPPQIIAEHAPFTDGPKIAITRDSGQALAVFHDGGFPKYVLLTAPGGNMQVSPVQELFYPRFALLPRGEPNNCVVPLPDLRIQTFLHPWVAAGNANTFYIAVTVSYFGTAPGCKVDAVRHEIWRNRTLNQNNLAVGWARILSVPVVSPFSVPTLLTQGGPSRSSTRPPFVVVRHQGADVALLAAEEKQTDNLHCNEDSRQKIVLYRITEADTCQASVFDGESCDGAPPGRVEPDNAFARASLGQKFPTWLVARAGTYQVQAGLYAGDGDDDPRVGLLWFSQPLRGRKTKAPNCSNLRASDEQQTWTIVEGAISPRAGATPGPVFQLTQGLPLNDAEIGGYFIPCAPVLNNFFGEYLGGAFLDDDPTFLNAVAAWADSRLGCDQLSTARRSTTHHQHVYAGGPYW